MLGGPWLRLGGCKPTDSVLGKRKLAGAWAGSTASSFREASRADRSWLGSAHWQLWSCWSFAGWLVLKESLFALFGRFSRGLDFF